MTGPNEREKEDQLEKEERLRNLPCQQQDATSKACEPSPAGASCRTLHAGRGYGVPQAQRGAGQSWGTWKKRGWTRFPFFAFHRSRGCRVLATPKTGVCFWWCGLSPAAPRGSPTVTDHSASSDAWVLAAGGSLLERAVCGRGLTCGCRPSTPLSRYHQATPVVKPDLDYLRLIPAN